MSLEYEWNLHHEDDKIKRLQDQLKEANNIISDFILETEHAPSCPGTGFDKMLQEWNECKCMDRNHFNSESNIERARDYQKKYGLED